VLVCISTATKSKSLELNLDLGSFCRHQILRASVVTMLTTPLVQFGRSCIRRIILSNVTTVILGNCIWASGVCPVDTLPTSSARKNTGRNRPCTFCLRGRRTNCHTKALSSNPEKACCRGARCCRKSLSFCAIQKSALTINMAQLRALSNNVTIGA